MQAGATGRHRPFPEKARVDHSTPKCKLIRRPVNTGKKSGQRLSGYGLQLREKQKIRRILRMMERQFRRTFFEAARRKRLDG
jgi:small subunit ribosomal protein S4